MKRFLSILLTSVIGLSLAACGSQSSETEETASEAAESGAEEEADTSSDDYTVRIGTMDLVNGDLIAQYEEYYENELGLPVQIIKFDSGKDVNTAFAAGSLDISELGSSPTALGLANGTDFKVFWVGDILGSAESLVVKDDSGIETLADLKGKKIATPFASTSHYSLLNAIKLEEGIEESDVILLDMQPADIYAAWQRGDIDGAYVWYPVLDELLQDGHIITHSGELAEKGVITGDLNIVSTAFAEKYPDVVTNYVKAQIKANDILNNDPDTAAAEIASILEISEEDAASQITQYEYLDAEEQIDFIDNQLAQVLKDTADFLVEQDSIKSAPELSDYEASVTSEFVKAAVE
ncbi:MAG: ABC transporter substrate-binding protein [Clostridiales bacterium]|nr:ABC transporter substrate-binding protein [Clostridiales bacterium]